MKKKYLIFLLLLSFPLYTRADKTLDSLLNVDDLQKSLRMQLSKAYCQIIIW